MKQQKMPLETTLNEVFFSASLQPIDISPSSLIGIGLISILCLLAYSIAARLTSNPVNQYCYKKFEDPKGDHKPKELDIAFKDKLLSFTIIFIMFTAGILLLKTVVTLKNL